MSQPPRRDEPPGWSVTWLLRVQRRHRTKPRPRRASNGKTGTGFQWFSWIVLAVLIITVVVLVWQGLLPRM